MIRLPPFFALRALEAAARHRSYSRAADELSVTHGAVSQQIRKLEAELGARLFERRGNAMIPTPDAERLAGEVGRALGVLHDAVTAFSHAADRDPLVVSLEPHFGTRWLPPRLPRLLTHPAGKNLDLRIEIRTADFVTDGVDMGVRYGRGDQQPGIEKVLLLRESLFPVCTPELAARLGVSRPEDLLTAPLIRHSWRPWRLWFSSLGLEEPAPSGPEFEDSAMIIGAALAGIGVALARSGMVEQELARGQLVRLLPNLIDDDYAFWIAWRADSRKLRRIHALRDWLLEIAAETGDAEALEPA